MSYGQTGRDYEIIYNSNRPDGEKKDISVRKDQDNKQYIEQYRITAKAAETIDEREKVIAIKETSKNIDLGLFEKKLDLALYVDASKAKVAINDSITEFSFDQNDILNLDLTDEDNSAIGLLSDQLPVYEVLLHNSDYNFRLSDYHERLKQGELGFVNNVYPMDDRITEYAGDGELEVYVTYIIELCNQTPAYKAKVDQLNCYFDPIYEPWNPEDNVSLMTGDQINKKYNVTSIDTEKCELSLSLANARF